MVVLDEPTAGVDVELRQQLWSYVRDLNAKGTTILLTTHYLEEAEELCDHIAIINHGQIVAQDSTPALLARLDRKEMTVVVDHDLGALPGGLDRFDAILETPRRIVFRYRPSRTRMAEILAALDQADLTVADLTTKETDLEDIFIRLTAGAQDPHPDEVARVPPPRTWKPAPWR